LDNQGLGGILGFYLSKKIGNFSETSNTVNVPDIRTEIFPTGTTNRAYRAVFSDSSLPASYEVSIAINDAGELIDNSPVVSELHSLEPPAGTPGIGVVIRGSGFGSSQGINSARICSTQATIAFWTDTAIGIVTPSAAAAGTTCVVDVQVGGNTLNHLPFTFTAPNFIEGGIRQRDGKPLPGVSIFSSKDGFTSAVRTSENGSFRTSSLSYGAYKITPKLSGYSFSPPFATLSLGSGQIFPQDFIAQRTGLSASNVSPDNGPANTRVTISGSGFGARDANSSVLFASSPANIISWNDTRVTVLAPAGPVAGGTVPVVVRAAAGASDQLPYNYPIPDKKAATVTPSGTFNPLVERLVRIGGDQNVAVYNVELTNQQKIWYYVIPSIIGNVTSENGFPLAKPFLIGPEQTINMGRVVFSGRSSLSFIADATIGIYPPCTSDACRERTLKLIGVIAVEFAVRAATGSGLPISEQAATRVLIDGILDLSPIVKLGTDIYKMLAAPDASQWLDAIVGLIGDVGLLAIEPDPILMALQLRLAALYPGFSWSSQLTTLPYLALLPRISSALEYVSAMAFPSVPKSGYLSLEAK